MRRDSASAPVVIAPPQQHGAERHVAHRLLIVQFDRAAGPSLRLVQRLRRIGRPAAGVVRNRGKRQPRMRRREIRIDLDRPAVHRLGLRDRLPSAAAEQFARPQPALVRLHVAGIAPAQPLLLALRQLDRQRADDLLDHLVLRREDVREIAIEPLGPEMPAAAGIDELRRDAHAIAGLADAALEHEAHAQVASDLLHLDRPALVAEGGVARDHEQGRNLREVGDQVFGHAVAEIFLLRIAAHVLERQDGDRWFVGQAQAPHASEHDRGGYHTRAPAPRCSSAAWRQGPHRQDRFSRGFRRGPCPTRRYRPVPRFPPAARRR